MKRGRRPLHSAHRSCFAGRTVIPSLLEPQARGQGVGRQAQGPNLGFLGGTRLAGAPHTMASPAAVLAGMNVEQVRGPRARAARNPGWRTPPLAPAAAAAATPWRNTDSITAQVGEWLGKLELPGDIIKNFHDNSVAGSGEGAGQDTAPLSPCRGAAAAAARGPCLPLLRLPQCWSWPAL